MADPRGFLKYERSGPKRRPPELRIKDWQEVYLPFGEDDLVTQAARCMDCGIPFCHQGCPLGNLIPEWNDFTYRKEWHEASERLHATNNFPEFTGRLCPAPCETACVLGISENPVSIKLVEQEIVERAFAKGLIKAIIPTLTTKFKVAIIGSGPAGLAAAQQLTRAGHAVTVFEKADRIGGLLRYGIPEFKMEKKILERRLDQMRTEGTRFVTGVEIGVDIEGDQLRQNFDAILIAIGSEVPRDLPIPGRDLNGVHQAMEFLPQANRVQEGDLLVPAISAHGKDVVIIGGGDTGADCLGTAHRQGARSITQIEIMARPSNERPSSNPWPTYPMLYRVSSAHEEGGERQFSINTEEFLSNSAGYVKGLRTHQVELLQGSTGMNFAKVEASTAEIPADLVLLAMGFIGVPKEGLVDQLKLTLSPRGSIATDDNWMTNQDKIFACGDARRGQSLIVWAISEGRSAASAVDQYLMKSTDLPAPITPRDFSLSI